MGRKKRKGKNGEHHHVDGGILPSLYPASRLCTIHDLLLGLLLPCLQHHHAPSSSIAPASSPLSSTSERSAMAHAGSWQAPKSAGTDSQHMENMGAGQSALAEMGVEVAWQAAATTAGADTSAQQAGMDKAALVAAAHSLLVREGDPEDYSFLLYHGYGVLSNNTPALGSTMLEQRWTHQQVIERVIQILFKQEKNSSNVLCFGFQQPRPRSSLEREKTAPAGLACVSDNAAVTVLNSKTWRTIHARVGDSIMLHLLSYADIFHPLPHKCYVQVAGTSVLISAQQIKFSEKWDLPTTKFPIDRHGTLEKKRRIVTTNDKHCKEVGSSFFDSHEDVRSGHWVSNASIHQKGTTRKRQRPHSWQRRKAKRSCNKPAEQKGAFNVMKARRVHMKSFEQELMVEASELCCVDFVRGGPATQGEIGAGLGTKAVTPPNSQNDNKSHSSFQMIGLGKSCSFDEVKNDGLNMPMPGLFSQQKLSCSVAAFSEQLNGVTNEKYQMMDGFSSRALFSKLDFGTQQQQTLKESNFAMPLARSCNTNGDCAGIGAGRRLINRTRMFYKAKFPHHAGLPKSHILQRLRSTYKDAAVLFEAIFGKEKLCRSNNFGQCCFMCSKMSSKCICCLLKKLISNARSCQFARFLKRHCSPCAKSLLRSRCPEQPAKDLHAKIRSKKHANQDDECIAKCRSKGVVNHADLLQGNCQAHAGKGFNGSKKVLAEERNDDFCSHSRVVAFVWAVCRRIIPEDLLGSRKNWRNLRKNIFAFVSLRRHESFSLEQCMFKLKLSGYAWCQEQCLHGCSLSKQVFGESNFPEGTEDDSGSSSRSQSKLKLRDCSRVGSAGGCPHKGNTSFQILKRMMLENWIFWLFSGLIVPLIQAHFYVTESEKYKQNVLFYRKSVWAKIKAGAVKEMMKSNFKRLSAQSTVSLLKQGSLGFSRARLLPKKVGVRLIANLGSSSALPVNGGGHKVARTRKGSERRGKQGNLLKSCARNVGTMANRRDRMGLMFRPINLVLRDLHQCLKYEQENHGEDLGCSVFDYNDAYLKLLPYIIEYKRVPKTVSPVYLVVCDVLQAFDTIKQDKLVEIVQEFVREDEYCVRRYGYASANMKSIKVFHERSAMSTGNSKTSLDIFLQLAAKRRSAVCIDQAYAVKLKRSHIVEVIKEHIQRNIVQIGQHYYLQVVGIPQGSTLSSLLCSLYYAHFERSRLAYTLHLENGLKRKKQVSIGTNIAITASSGLTRADSKSCCLKPQFNVKSATLCSINHSVGSIKCFVSQSNRAGGQCLPSPLSRKSMLKTASAGIADDAEPRNIMLRLVDDWLFISNSQKDALEFVRKMHRGFVEYNCVANRLKTAVSFDAVMGNSDLNMNVYRTRDEACYIRWSGLLINCNTLEVQADYTRYCGVDLRSTLTVWRRNNQGYYLKKKLCQFMRPKCHPIFYDANINSPATAFLNAYQAFLLCAMKFHAYNCSLPCKNRCNSEFGFKAIQNCARYMHSLLSHRTNKISKSAPVKPLLLLPAKETQWLAFCAFRIVLMRKQSRYKRLLYLIRAELRCPKYNGLGETPLMLSALDARRSSMFEDIIY